MCKCVHWVTLAFEVCVTILSGLPHFSPPTDATRNGEPGVLLRLRAKQFDLLCFLFCPSLKGKDVPTLLQDCTSLCPGNHETAWETEILSPCPLPPLEKKKMPDRAGFVQEPWWSQAWREFPFSGAVWCLDFEDLYQKWEKQCYQKVGEGSCSVFKQIQKQMDSSWFSGLEGWTTSLMATVRPALDLGHLSNLGWAQSENKLGFSYFTLDNKEGTDPKLFI